MIKAVFFDVGGVLIKDNTRLMLRRQSRSLGVPYNDLRLRMKGDRLLLTKGTITRREYLGRLQKRFGLQRVTFSHLRFVFPRRYTIIAAPWRIARRLRENGYRVGIITNATRPPSFAPRLRLTPLFWPIIRSYQVGHTKPEREIYEIARRRAKVKFREMIFFDDRPKNVIAAKRLGIKAFVHKNSAQLVRQLRRLGVRI